MAKNLYWANALTGGGTGALDAIDGAGLADFDAAIVVTATAVYLYSLDADSAASESSPNVISPDANAGDKRWVLASVNCGQVDADKVKARSSAGLYLHEDGGEGIFVADGGNLDFTKMSSVHAYREGGQTIADDTITKVQLNAEARDVLGEFNITTYRFTAQRAGVYNVLAGINWNSSEANQVVVLYIYKNGAAVWSTLSYALGTEGLSQQAALILPLSASDYVELYVYQNSTASKTLSGATAYSTFLQIHKIG